MTPWAGNRFRPPSAGFKGFFIEIHTSTAHSFWLPPRAASGRRTLPKRLLIGRGEFIRTSRWVFARVPTIPEPVHASPGNQVDMNVWNDLTGGAALIDKNIESFRLRHPNQRASKRGNG